MATRTKRANAWVGCQGLSIRETMNPGLQSETMESGHGSHDAAERVGGAYHANRSRKQVTKLHMLSCSYSDGGGSRTTTYSTESWCAPSGTTAYG